MSDADWTPGREPRSVAASFASFSVQQVSCSVFGLLTPHPGDATARALQLNGYLPIYIISISDSFNQYSPTTS